MIKNTDSILKGDPITTQNTSESQNKTISMNEIG
jgi:hypothetical protein